MLKKLFNINYQLILISVLNILDLISTLYLLKTYPNMVIEANPIMNYVLNLGTIYFILAKLFLVILSIVVFKFAYKSSPKTTISILSFINIIYLSIIGVHCYVLYSVQ